MGDEWKAVLVAVGYALTCATISGIMARRKGRNVGLWFAMGCLLGIFAPVILGLLDNAGIRWIGRK